MASPIYPQGHQQAHPQAHQGQQAHPQAQHMNQLHQPGPQPMMREISHDGQVGGGYSQQQMQSPVGANVQQQQQPHAQQQQAPPAAAAAQPPPMNLASVMHYLQSEWRRWERDRNEWEIERAEMRARIALLEGERRSAENLKMVMLRRVKMLEFALKQERGKSLAAAGAGGAGAGTRAPQSAGAVLSGSNSFASMTPAKAALALGLTASESGEKKDGGDSPKGGDQPEQVKKSNGVSPDSEAKKEKPAAAGVASTSRTGSVDSNHVLGAGAANPWKSTVSMPIRDPKSRARSRDYLKQCLQEISYLTSPAAMNPLPNRLPLTLTVPPSTSDPSSSGLRTTAPATEPTQASLAAGTILEVPERPRKTLSEAVLPPSQPGLIGLGVKVPGDPSTDPTAQEPLVGLSNLAQEVVAEEQERQQQDASKTGEPSRQDEVDAEQGKVLTAIYKPESKEAWKQALRQANEQAEKTRSSVAKSQASDATSDAGDALETMSNSSADSDVTAIHDDDVSVKKGWKPTRQLKSHLDSVHAVVFGPEATVVTGSWDCTVKIWRLASDKSGNRSGDELEPQITFRGHLAPVTCLAVSYTGRRVFSGSLDSSIRVWNMPPAEHHTYSPYDSKFEDDALVGHTDAVWALTLLPSAPDEPEGYLVSAGSDGSVKVWLTTQAETGYPLVSGWKYDGTTDLGEEEPENVVAAARARRNRPVPVAVTVYHPDLSQVLVGYNNGVIKLFEIKTGRVVREFENGDSGASLTDVICHPTMSLVIAAMNDGTMRIYDLKTGKIQQTIQAHSSTINALRVDPTSSSDIITAGDDLSIKVWNLESMTNTHEWTAHRKKGEQGVLALDVSDDPGLVAAAGAAKDKSGRLAALVSGGADGTVRLYSKA